MAASFIKGKGMSSHLERWITGLIAVPILFAVIALGSRTIFAALIIVVSIAGMHEYNEMAFGKGVRNEKILTIFISLLILMTAAYGKLTLLVPLITFSLMTVLMLNLLHIKKKGLGMSQAERVILGILYVPLLMSHFIMIRQNKFGVLWIFFILVMAFAGDIAAYYVGKRSGKRKLLLEVSPGKTVEGTIGLISGSIVGCLIFRQLFFPMLAVMHAVILGFVGSIVGQLGDLSESALKRSAGVKDSGALLPGHGGILDRLDCLMFIAPFVYYYQEYIIQ